MLWRWSFSPADYVSGDTTTEWLLPGARGSESGEPQLRETELVPVGVADMKEALAPGSIHRLVGL